MARYRLRAMAELAHQLRMSPSRLRLRQLDGIEHLASLIESDKSYPYEFVCYHITGYRSRQANSNAALTGETLLGDLAVLAEDISAHPVMAAIDVPQRVWSTEQLARRLSVSTKTICRWRRRGLAGRRLRFEDGTIRVAFLDRTIRRFVSKNIDFVRRGAAFKQLTDEERLRIVTRARELLSEKRLRLHELAQILATETGRAVETVRYTLRRHDEGNPDDSVLGTGELPAVRPEHQELFEAWTHGVPVNKLAKHFRLTAADVEVIIRETRTRRLLAKPLECIYSHEFDAPNADELILSDDGARPQEACDEEAPAAVRGVPRDLPPYLQDLYRQPLLTKTQERALFRQYNYLKFKAAKIVRRLTPAQATNEALAAAEALLARAEQVKNRITAANLRLVVSIARRHAGLSNDFLEVVSDGNMTLMRALEKFDYTLGYKFSTYASWAIMRSYARSIPEARYEAGRYVTSSEEILDIIPDTRETSEPVADEGLRKLVERGLSQLDVRERAVLTRHFGLGRDGKIETLDQIGKDFGLTKERIRQIERKALDRLREAFAEERAVADFDTG